MRLGYPARPDYRIVNNTVNLPSQNDAISCGAFVCLYAFHKVFHASWPTTDTFKPHNHMDMRAVIMDASLTGRLRRPFLNVQADIQPPGAGGANDIIYMELTEGDDVPVRTRTADGHFYITNVDVAEQAALLASFNKTRAQATVTAGARKVI